MKKFLGTLVLIIVVFFAGAFAGPYLPALPFKNNNIHTETTVISMKFDDIAELATESLTGQYIFSKTDDGKQVLNYTLPLTSKKILIQYDGTAKAGIKDASKIELLDNDETNHIIKMSAPEVEFLDVYTDNDKIWDEKSSIFNHFSIEDYPDLKNDILKDFNEKVKASDLLDRAQKSAENFIEDRVKSYYGDEYTVEVEWVNSQS